MPKVLISDKLSPKAKAIFEARGIEVDVKVGMTPDELAACIGAYDGLAIRSATKVTDEIIAAADNLKAVGRAGIGVDNVDIPAASAKGIIVMNTPFGNSITTAEHAIAMMFSAARKIPAASASTHAGKWEKSKFMGTELYNKTLGLIGCGNIGSIVADRAHGLKMKVIASDPFLSQERADQMNIKKVELDELLAEADFITLHTPLNDATRNILGEKSLQKVKEGVFIINCARGGLVDEAALKAAIERGQVAGAALDVFAEEPAKENVLFGMEQVVCTPHLGASTSEAQENVAIQVAEQISDYLLEGTVTNALNVPSVSAEEAKVLSPYIELGEKLGQFVGQINEAAITQIRIEYDGLPAKLNTKPISAAAVKGALSASVQTVNMINAPSIAKERNIEVSETSHERERNYQTLITITLETDKGTHTASGTLFGGDKPRLVEVNDIRLEAAFGQNVIYVNNEDKPGLIGNLGRVLGESDINVANFHLGRGDKANDALALVEVDSEVNDNVLGTIRDLPSVKTVHHLAF